jgi:hypothetical protein
MTLKTYQLQPASDGDSSAATAGVPPRGVCAMGWERSGR